MGGAASRKSDGHGHFRIIHHDELDASRSDKRLSGGGLHRRFFLRDNYGFVIHTGYQCDLACYRFLVVQYDALCSGRCAVSRFNKLCRVNLYRSYAGALSDGDCIFSDFFHVICGGLEFSRCRECPRIPGQCIDCLQFLRNADLLFRRRCFSHQCDTLGTRRQYHLLR